MKVVLAGLLLLLCFFRWAGCGGDERREGLALYHLETAIGPPGRDGNCGAGRREPPARASSSSRRRGTFHYAVLEGAAL